MTLDRGMRGAKKGPTGVGHGFKGGRVNHGTRKTLRRLVWLGGEVMSPLSLTAAS